MAQNNERITENIFRDRLRELGYYAADNDIRIEEQKSQIAEVSRLLKGASKTGGTGVGAPEFIISSSAVPDLILIVECKADVRRHSSPNLDRPADFAVDGVLHYARALAKSFHVIAIAASGQHLDELRISTYLHAKDVQDPRELLARSGAPLNEILTMEDYLDAAQYDPEVEKGRIRDLMSFSRDLHVFMRDYGKLTEAEKPLLVSGTLLALRNDAFARGYTHYKPEELQRQWWRVLRDELEAAEIPHAKKPT